MIQIEHVSKTFSGKYGTVHALDDVSIHVEKGDICGIIGFSGAGKSTLIRLVNGLETADSGKVTVCGKELSALKKPELRALRRKIGMVFQQFNLLESKTVYHNIALPLILAKTPKAEIDKKVMEVLKIVELEDKKDTYISQLSGGQKQRVGIARALTTDPELLLCDEATSALDPQTTGAILQLLKHLNEKLGITIVIITHEMAVVKEICDRVAVMEHGNVVEEGDVYSIFAAPKAGITRDFIRTTSNLQKIEKLVEEKSPLVALKPGEKILRLNYIKKNTSEALISEASRRFSVDLNIIFADIEIVQDAPIGGTVAIASGTKENIEAAIEYLKEKNVGVEVIENA